MLLPPPIPTEAALAPLPPFEQQLNLVDVMGGGGGGGGRGGEMLSLQPARINRPNRGWIERERERREEERGERAAYIT